VFIFKLRGGSIYSNSFSKISNDELLDKQFYFDPNVVRSIFVWTAKQKLTGIELVDEKGVLILGQGDCTSKSTFKKTVLTKQ
jgi:hypothetical protein